MSRFLCFLLGGRRKGRGGRVRNSGHEHGIGQAQKAENTDPRTNCEVKYATARGHLTSPKKQNKWEAYYNTKGGVLKVFPISAGP